MIKKLEMIMDCPNCSSMNDFEFEKKSEIKCIEGTSFGIYKCLTCNNRWVGKKHEMYTYKNVIDIENGA